jgi:hypothetical protein
LARPGNKFQIDKWHFTLITSELPRPQGGASKPLKQF